MGASLGFWLLAVALLLAALAFVLPALLQGRPAPAPVWKGDVNASVCRHQLAELERDARLGLIGAAEAERARDELQRRLLEDTREPFHASRVTRGRSAALGVALALPLSAVGLYLALGSPQSLRAPALMAGAADGAAADAVALEEHLRSTPRDARGWVLLARSRAQAGAYAEAAHAYSRALQASANVARDPAVLCELADALGMAQGGSLAGQPAQIIAQALAIDATHPMALEMAGSASYEAGDYAGAVRHWQRLLPQIANAPRRQEELAAAIARAQARAGAPQRAAAAAR